jgi:hypothetical protein
MLCDADPKDCREISAIQPCGAVVIHPIFKWNEGRLTVAALHGENAACVRTCRESQTDARLQNLPMTLH